MPAALFKEFEGQGRVQKIRAARTLRRNTPAAGMLAALFKELEGQGRVQKICAATENNQIKIRVPVLR